MKTTRRQYLVLFLLFFLFAAPGLSAYFLYFHPEWLRSPTTNKGQLLKPPILLTQLGTDAKWRLLLWSPKTCGHSCELTLDKLARIRLALGRRLYDVDLFLVLGAEHAPLSDALQEGLHKQGFAVLRLPSDVSSSLSDAYSDPALFISNPENYLVLAYLENALPDDVFHDIKHLLAKGS